MAQLPDVLTSPLSGGVRLLLESRIPARVAWTSRSGVPRVVPIWFHWDGGALVMATFSGSRKLDDLDDGSIVAVTIDTETFPYRQLKMNGPVTIEPTAGLAPQYRLAAERYLGPELGPKWCASLGDAQQAIIRLTPRWAVASDMSAIPFLAES